MNKELIGFVIVLLKFLLVLYASLLIAGFSLKALLISVFITVAIIC